MSKQRGGFPSGFRCLGVSRIAGSSVGYALGVIHRLADGSAWRQISDRTEIFDAECPAAWLYTDGSVSYLDIDGTHGIVEVARCRDPEAPDPSSGLLRT